jgi:hypothetical protein
MTTTDNAPLLLMLIIPLMAAGAMAMLMIIVPDMFATDERPRPSDPRATLQSDERRARGNAIRRVVGLAVLILILAVVTGSLSGCGGDEPRYATLRAAAIDVGTAWCNRAIQCHIYSEEQRDACEYGFVEGACGNDCDGPFTGREADVDTCIDALEVWQCSVAGPIPAECLGVL